MTQRIDRDLRQLLPADPETARLGWACSICPVKVRNGSTLKSLLTLLLFSTLQRDFQEAILLPPPADTGGPHTIRQSSLPTPLGHSAYSDSTTRNALRHVMIVGMSGAGKSNLTLHILRALHAAKKPFLVLDWKRGLP